MFRMGQSIEYRQSARLFLQSSELGLPHPLTSRRVHAPPPLWFRAGGTHSLAGEGMGGGEGGFQFGREDRHCGPGVYSRFIYMYFYLLDQSMCEHLTS
jgi:hypothetical protein